MEPAQEKEMLQSTKLNGIRDVEHIVTSDMGMQSLEVAQLVFGLALVQHFFIMLPYLHFEMVIYILDIGMCDLLFFFYFDLYR